MSQVDRQGTVNRKGLTESKIFHPQPTQ